MTLHPAMRTMRLFSFFTAVWHGSVVNLCVDPERYRDSNAIAIGDPDRYAVQYCAYLGAIPGRVFVQTRDRVRLGSRV